MRAKWIRSLLVLAGAGLALLLAGCDGDLETKIIYPRSVWTFYQGRRDAADFACFPVTCFSTAGGGPTWVPSPPGRCSVGFDYWLDEGTPPCNCWETVSHAYRGAVRFELSNLPKSFVSATLVIQPQASERIEGETASNDESGTIGGIFLASTQWWLGINTTVFTDENGTDTASAEVSSFPAGEAFVVPFPENPGAEFPEKAFPVRKEGSRYVLEISNQVKAWRKNAEPNNGFILVGRDESLALKTNHVRVASYQVWMEVIFNPEQQ